ncbi:MAG: hypothetical protein QNK23_05115 [Crocinitomicaceae bacterium]|nr:hypothetical protein [Crocinitomicaceae bacterium]
MIEGILMLTGVLIILFAIFIWTNYKAKKRGWKVKKDGNSKQQYLELDGNNWRSITFDCEMYSNDVPRHAIIISKDWEMYPEWAQDKKDEIITRLKNSLKEPAYTIIEK